MAYVRSYKTDKLKEYIYMGAYSDDPAYDTEWLLTKEDITTNIDTHKALFKLYHYVNLSHPDYVKLYAESNNYATAFQNLPIDSDARLVAYKNPTYIGSSGSVVTMFDAPRYIYTAKMRNFELFIINLPAGDEEASTPTATYIGVHPIVAVDEAVIEDASTLAEFDFSYKITGQSGSGTIDGSPTVEIKTRAFTIDEVEAGIVKTGAYVVQFASSIFAD